MFAHRTILRNKRNLKASNILKTRKRVRRSMKNHKSFQNTPFFILFNRINERKLVTNLKTGLCSSRLAGAHSWFKGYVDYFHEIA